MQEASVELKGVLEDDLLSKVPIAILANKIDVPSAMGEAELTYKLNLFDLRTGKTQAEICDNDHRRPVELFMVSLLRRQGYGEAFRWVAEYLK